MLSIQQRIADRIYDFAEGLCGDEEGENEKECMALAEEILGLFAFSSTSPTEPGWYWFNGNLVNPNGSALKQVCVEVVKSNHADTMHFMIEKEFYWADLPGLWAKALVPQIPSEEK